MTSNFIPMLSSSPPPLDDGGSIDEDDDDFHDFLSAAKVLDSPTDSPAKTPDTSPTKTIHPIVEISQIPDTEADLTCRNVLSDPNETDVTLTNFQKISSHNEIESPELNSSKEFTEFYTCSSKTTEDDLDFNIPPLEHNNGFSDEEFESNFHSDDSPKCDIGRLKIDLKKENGTSVEDGSNFLDNQLDEIKKVAEVEAIEIQSCDKTPSIPIQNELEHHEEEDDDDFADFECATFDKQIVFSKNEENVIKDENNEADIKENAFASEKDDSFADFATASFDPGEINESFTEFESSDNQWADFATGTRLEDTPECISHELTIQGASSESLQKFVLAFPLLVQNSFSSQEVVFPKLSHALKSSGMLWTRLEDLDQSFSLRHQWIGSEAFQKTLQSLNIDSRNILRNPTIPLFALGLGPLLEPVKVDTGLSLEESAYSNKPSSPNLEPQENFIPPAQFDWNSSGLVNPLDPTQASSSLLDLDFFNTADYASTSKSVAKTFSLEEELLGQDSKLAANHLQLSNPPNQHNILLEQLMSNIKLSNSTVPPTRKQSDNLSEGAIQILKRIPDLSFVKAKVLMFPVHSDHVS